MACATGCLLSLLMLALTISQGLSVSHDEASQVLFDSMLSKYDRRVPPPGKDGIDTPVAVKSTMYVLDIEKVSFYYETVRAQFYFRQKWTDPRLRYDNKDTKVTSIYVQEPEKIWKPDLFFNQEIEGKAHDITMPNIFIRISPEGTILYSIRVSVTFRCRMDFRKFPFDTQKCLLTAESYGYSKKRIELAWDSMQNAVAFNENITLREYTLTNIDYTVEEITLSSSEYSALNVYFTLERKAAFYALKLFVPFVFLSALSWLSFWITPKHITMRLTLLLTVLFIMVEIGREIDLYYIPSTTYTKGSDVWIAVCESLAIGSLLEFMLVSLLGKREKSCQDIKVDEEITADNDVEAKKEADNKQANLTSSARIVARNLFRGTDLPKRIDFISKIMFPIAFALFNIVYWSVYCAKE